MGQTILVIGASSSIGPAMVGAFVARGYDVIATSRSGELSAEGATCVPLDLANPQSRTAVMKRLSVDGVQLAAVVMLAGTINGEPLDWYDDDAAQAIMQTNFTAQALFIRDIAPLIDAKGRLILLGSIASERGSFDPLYAASKGAMLPFAKSLAHAYGKRFSTITVLPGPIQGSTMFDEMEPSVQARHLDQSPTGEILNATDLAGIVADLASPHWRHANGSIIRVNEGSYV